MGEGSLLQLALSTAIVGMSVVFIALFLLSIYMNLFKRFMTHLHRKRESSAQAQREGKERVSREQPSPSQGETALVGDEEARIAAAAALGIEMGASHGAADGAMAAAIAVALARGGKSSHTKPEVAEAGTPRWKVAGWFESHGSSARGRGGHRAR